MKTALNLASKAQDNHLRALILALISSLYIRTASDHARTMLETCGQLAAGLGAPAQKQQNDADAATSSSNEPPRPSGNLPLCLWVGERFLGSFFRSFRAFRVLIWMIMIEIYKQNGQDKKVQKQQAINTQLSKALHSLEQRQPAL